MKNLLYCLLLLFLVACQPKMSQQEFQSTLDSMVQKTLGPPKEITIATFTRTPVMLSGPSATPEKVEPTSTDTPLPTTNTVRPDPTRTPAPTASILACLVGFDAANIRTAPNENAPRVMVLEKGRCITLIGKTENGEWVRSNEGWTPVRFFDLSRPIDLLPILDE